MITEKELTELVEKVRRTERICCVARDTRHDLDWDLWKYANQEEGKFLQSLKDKLKPIGQ